MQSAGSHLPRNKMFPARKSEILEIMKVPHFECRYSRHL